MTLHPHPRKGVCKGRGRLRSKTNVDPARIARNWKDASFLTCLHPRRVSCFDSRFAGKWSGHSAGTESPPRLVGCGSVLAVGFLWAEYGLFEKENLA